MNGRRARNDVVFRMPAGFAREIGMETPGGVDCFQDDRQPLQAASKSCRKERRAANNRFTQTRRFITNVIVCPCDRERIQRCSAIYC